jgi:ElaA protein
MPAITWRCKFFDELTPYELYAVMSLRNEVFVVEQNCVFQDADNKDQASFHLMGFVGSKLATYARLVPCGVIYTSISIGRVVTATDYRKLGHGKSLMRKAIEECYRLFGRQAIKIGAQMYLKNFYEGFGFLQCSEIYMEDGIPHIIMLKENL